MRLAADGHIRCFATDSANEFTTQYVLSPAGFYQASEKLCLGLLFGSGGLSAGPVNGRLQRAAQFSSERIAAEYLRAMAAEA